LNGTVSRHQPFAARRHPSRRSLLLGLLASTVGNPELPLFSAFPELGRRTRRVVLGDYPTPVARAGGLERELGLGALYVKRDDVSARPYGGGKPRKLELLLGDALERDCRTLITAGAVGSNHAVATAVYARALGLRAVLLLMPEPRSAHVRENLAADLHFGAEILAAHGSTHAAALARRLASTSPTACVVPLGGTSPLGNIGFVNAGFELELQIERGELPEPDVVYVPLGTMGAAVGLAIGLAAAGLRTRVVAVRASSVPTSDQSKLASLFRMTVDFIRQRAPRFPNVELSPERLVIEGRQLGRGYAFTTARSIGAVALGRRHQLELETTYTGKALAALIADAPRLAGKTVLFWNTHNSLPLDVGGVKPDALPRELRGYAGGTRRG
jgi:D-cysteine desulfhydrase